MQGDKIKMSHSGTSITDKQSGRRTQPQTANRGISIATVRKRKSTAIERHLPCCTLGDRSFPLSVITTTVLDLNQK